MDLRLAEDDTLWRSAPKRLQAEYGVICDDDAGEDTDGSRCFKDVVRSLACRSAFIDTTPSFFGRGQRKD